MELDIAFDGGTSASMKAMAKKGRVKLSGIKVKLTQTPTLPQP